MAHEIDETTGQAAVFTGSNTPAWHGLGTTIKGLATSAEAMELAHLNWEVEQWPLQAVDPSGVDISRCLDKVANVRTDTQATLGVVSPGYHVFQNSEAFDFMDAIVGEKLAMYDTAGSLKGGRKIWMLAKIPKEYRVGDDVVEPYVLITNSHDGTQSLRMVPTTVRVFCQNTLTYAMRSSKTALSIRHWPRLEGRVKEARKNLGIITQSLDQFGEEMQALAARKLSVSEIQSYFLNLFPTSTRDMNFGDLMGESTRALSGDNPLQEKTTLQGEALASSFAASEAAAKKNRVIIDKVMGNFENRKNNLPGIENSAWSAYNSVSEWVDHDRGSRGRDSAERADNRLHSVWFGSSNAIKQRAYSDALQLVV